MSARRCVLAGSPGHRCLGRVQWHHPIKQQRIRDRFPRGAYRQPSEAVWSVIPKYTNHADLEAMGNLILTLPRILRDPRNRLWACTWSAHPTLEGDYRNLPGSVWEFAREFGLDAALEGDIRRQGG